MQNEYLEEKDLEEVRRKFPDIDKRFHSVYVSLVANKFKEVEESKAKYKIGEDKDFDYYAIKDAMRDIEFKIKK